MKMMVPACFSASATLPLLAIFAEEKRKMNGGRGRLNGRRGEVPQSAAQFLTAF